jgi:hypothetical protein
MNELKFKYRPTDLLKRIEDNRGKHEEEYNKAMEGYYIEVEEQFIELVKDVKKARKRAAAKEEKFDANFYIHAVQPTNHLDDYDRVIDMLKLTQDEEIELDEQQFGQYVRDEWSWKQNFTTTNSAYLAKASR